MKNLLRQNWKKIIVSIFILCLVIVLGIIFAIKKGILFYPTLTEQLQNKPTKVNGSDIANMPEDMLNTYICMVNIHHMANTKIIAQDGLIWGRQTMSNKEIDMCINYISANPNISRRINVNELIQYLNEWKVNNYSHAVELHNMVWEYLGGTVGKAIKLKG